MKNSNLVQLECLLFFLSGLFTLINCIGGDGSRFLDALFSLAWLCAGLNALRNARGRSFLYRLGNGACYFCLVTGRYWEDFLPPKVLSFIHLPAFVGILAFLTYDFIVNRKEASV